MKKDPGGSFIKLFRRCAGFAAHLPVFGSLTGSATVEALLVRHLRGLTAARNGLESRVAVPEELVRDRELSVVVSHDLSNQKQVVPDLLIVDFRHEIGPNADDQRSRLL